MGKIWKTDMSERGKMGKIDTQLNTDSKFLTKEKKKERKKGTQRRQ